MTYVVITSASAGIGEQFTKALANEKQNLILVARREEGAMDDGWLIPYVYDRNIDTSSVVILNADDLEGEPQAVIELPVRVPPGFHANWITDA